MRNLLGALVVLTLPFGLFGHLAGAPNGSPGGFWIRVAAIAVAALLLLAAYRVRTGLLGPGLAAALALCAYPALPDAAASPHGLGRVIALAAFGAVLLGAGALVRAPEGRARGAFLVAAGAALAWGFLSAAGAEEFGAEALGPAVLPGVAFAVLAGEIALLLVRRGDPRSGPGRAVVAGLAVVLLGAAAIGQWRAAAWSDGRAFWGRAVAESPGSPAALGALAGACADAGDRVGAEAGLRGFAEAAAGAGGSRYGEEARRLGASGVARAAKLLAAGSEGAAPGAEAADAALRAAREFAPGSVPVIVALCDARLAQGEFLEPIRLLEKAVASDRGAAEAWDALARARLAAGRVPEALAAARTATGLRPLDKGFVVTWADVLLSVGRGGEALEGLRRALGPAPPYDPALAHAYAAAELRLARADISAGRRGAARRKLLSAGEVDPGNGACEEGLADLDRQMEAERPAAERLMVPGPNGKVLPDDWILYAKWLCGWGEFEKADREFRVMLNKMGTTAAVHLVYGQWFWEERGSVQGVERAVEAYKQAIALDDRLVEAWNRLWQCQRRLGRGDDAVFAARKFLELAPGHPDAAEAQQFLEGR